MSEIYEPKDAMIPPTGGTGEGKRRDSGERAATAKTARYRVNLKETAKGIVTVDCTAECEVGTEAVLRAVALLALARIELKAAGRQVAE